MKGIPELQAAMAALLERFVVPGHSVDPAHLCISSGAWLSGRCLRQAQVAGLGLAACSSGWARLQAPPPAGCSAILDSLFYCLCDEGEGVLIPAPYYPAFDNDLQVS
jgi:hypothetical protein